MFAPALMVRGNVNPATLKSDPTTLAAETVTEPVPLFVNVVVFVPLFPITTLPKARLVGDALSKKVGAAVAVPESDTTGGVFGALLVIVSVPEKLPVAVGANLTVKFVAWPAGTEIGNVAPTRLNPVPATVALVTDIVVPPVFEICTGSVVDVFTTMLPKPRLVGDTAICAGDAVTVTVAEADFVLSATLVALTVKEPVELGAV